MTRKGGTSQACASCKYQRRRCKVDCPLAPYFPADQPNMFQNAHRLFGVSNIIKILKQIDPSQRGVAMKSIIDQANARAKYPVYGCVAEIQQLMLKIQLAEEELQAVQAQLAFYRQHNQQQQQQQQEISSTGPGPTTDSVLPLQLGTLPPPLPISPPTNAPGFSLFHQDPPPQYCNAAAFPVSHPSSYSNAAYNTSNATTYVNSKDNNNINSLWIQQHFTNSNSNTNNNNNNNNTVNPMMMQPQMGSGTAQPITIQQQEENIQDYDEIHPFFDTIDDRQSYIDSKEAYESSSESSLKDIAQSVEHVSENELKSAAACFSLTSVNL
ncbi:PREDICTED: LOB domain-containing protein 27 [Ipomoea nil]|uniref:LOB domain-containing protein 27 n=1 Tax=Ipomoea nil TaxID=35883 RepID=UPI0009012AE1|nr:PREDICTED: LOB domain-containing protein 27 [Ipomoea nil]